MYIYISVTTCGTVVRRHRVDNTWPVAALTAPVKPADIGSKSWFLPIPHLHSTPPLAGFPSEYRHIATPFGMEKLEWCGYPMVKNFSRNVCSFRQNPRTWRTDGYDGIGRAYACISRSKNINIFGQATAKAIKALQCWPPYKTYKYFNRINE